MENMLNLELEEKIKNAENLTDVVNACAEYGINVTEEQLEKVMENADKEELSEEELEDVSGGLFFAIVAACIASAGLSSFMRTWRRMSRKKH